MEQFEPFSTLKILPDIPFVIRLDGRNFHHLAERVPFARPFDPVFMNCLSQTAKDFFEISGLNPTFAFLFSDEVNLLFLAHQNPFARRVEKICSITAGFFSTVFSIHLSRAFEHHEELLGIFDARIISLPTTGHLFEYFIHRQQNAFRNCVNSYAFYSLVQQRGLTSNEATSLLEGMGKAKQMALLFHDFAINVNDVPAWQRRGWGLYKDRYEKMGINPLTGERTTAIRRKVKVELDLPLFTSEAGANFLQACIQREDLDARTI